MLKSNRLQFRKMVESDIEKYHSWRNDFDVMKTTSPSLDLYSFDETRNFVENVILNSTSSRSYIIEEREGKRAIGVTSLKILIQKIEMRNVSLILVKRIIG